MSLTWFQDSAMAMREFKLMGLRPTTLLPYAVHCRRENQWAFE